MTNPTTRADGPSRMFVLAVPEDLIPTVFDHLAALPPAIASRVLVGACGLDEAEPTAGQEATDGK